MATRFPAGSNSTDARAHPAWVNGRSGRSAEIAAFGAMLTAIILQASSSEHIEERSFVPAPPLASMPEQPSNPMAIGGAHFTRTFDVSSFRRGNLHTHTNRSDGDSSPRDVYTWYRDHGYDFVAITDHNTFTNPADYTWIQGPKFVAIGGEEVTMQGAGRQVHMNALCTDHMLAGGKFPTAKEALLHGVAEIRNIGGVALVNHPNFTWGLRGSDLPAALGAQLLEIHSGHPYVATLGDSSHPSHEAMWDAALTSGLDFMGVAVDDAHHLHQPNRTRASHPGRAWVEVFADSLDEGTICRALAHGLLYASTGPSLARIQVTEDSYSIWPAGHDDEVQFIGAGGRLLSQRKLGQSEAFASYKLVGPEGYVRARISSKDGKTAWTPAVRIQLNAGEANATKASADEGPPG